MQKMSVLGDCAAHPRITPVYPRPSTSAVVPSTEDYAASGARQVHADRALPFPTPLRLPFGEELRDTLRLLGACMRSMQYVWYTLPAVLVYQVYVIYVYIHVYMLKTILGLSSFIEKSSGTDVISSYVVRFFCVFQMNQNPLQQGGVTNICEYGPSSADRCS